MVPKEKHMTASIRGRLLLAASRLIRNDPEFQRLMTDLRPAN
jgi:hypothetical protein